MLWRYFRRAPAHHIRRRVSKVPQTQVNWTPRMRCFVYMCMGMKVRVQAYAVYYEIGTMGLGCDSTVSREWSIITRLTRWMTCVWRA